MLPRGRVLKRPDCVDAGGVRLSNGGRAAVSPSNLQVIVASLSQVACFFNIATKKVQNIIFGKG